MKHIQERKMDYSYQYRLKPLHKRKLTFINDRKKKVKGVPIPLKNDKDLPITINKDILNGLDFEKLAGEYEDKKKTRIEREFNHIYFYSEVNRESIYELIFLIREAQEECLLTQLKMNVDDVPIYIHLSSFGGSIFDAFTAIDVIKASKIPIHTIIDGSSASAGTLISVVGKKRFIRPNSYMLIHQLSSGCWGKYSEIQDEFKNLKDLTKRIKDIYTEHTTIP